MEYKKKSILIVDYLNNSRSHISYNSSIINYYINNNYEVTLYLNSDHYENLSINRDASKVKFFKDLNIKINPRLNLIYKITQLNKLNYSNDILFLSYEILSICFMKNRNIVLTNHNNLSHLNTKLKKIVFKNLVKKKNHIVLTNDSLMFLKGLDFENVSFQMHPLPQSFNTNINPKHITFLSKENQNNKEILEILKNEKIQDFIFQKNINIYYRVNISVKNSKNILKISQNLKYDDYKNLINKSKIIVFAFNEDFKYRISNMILECITNNKVIIIYGNTYINKKDYPEYENLFFIKTVNKLIDILHKKYE